MVAKANIQRGIFCRGRSPGIGYCLYRLSYEAFRRCRSEGVSAQCIDKALFLNGYFGYLFGHLWVWGFSPNKRGDMTTVWYSKEVFCTDSYNKYFLYMIIITSKTVCYLGALIFLSECVTVWHFCCTLIWTNNLLLSFLNAHFIR